MSVQATSLTDTDVDEILNDLVRETLGTLFPVTLGLAWLWLSGEIVRGDSHLAAAYVALATLLVARAVGWSLGERQLRAVVWFYIGGLLAAVTIVASAAADASALYLYILVVLAASMLADSRTMLAVSTASIALILVVGLNDGVTSPTALILPVLYVALTALIAWLSSRRLFTALAWALMMTRESQKNATEARERRAEVLRILKNLDDAYVRLEWANEALIFAREAAQKAYQFKAEFVANVSHELRTPLNLITGFSEMMATSPESYRDTPLPSEYRGDVVAIYRSARHLSDLINDVLDLSKIEAGRLPIRRESADLAEIVHEATEIVQGLADSKGLELLVDLPSEPIPLYLDRTRIRQVLLNLLTNALRFTDAGWIRTTVQLAGDEATVTVTDSGCGIDAERLAQAFESFSQLHDDQERKGTGLGLALSRKFVELHGGTMWIDSTLGAGTTVSFTMPVTTSELTQRIFSPIVGGPGRGGQPQVLVLHDDPRVIPLLRHYVDGYHFILAETIEEAWPLIRESVPVAIVVDRECSDDRVSATALDELRRHLPVICCRLPSLHRVGLLLGAVDYLVKPISRDDLLIALERLPAAPETVLLVDDDPNFVRLLGRVLTTGSPAPRVLEASSALEGLAIARSQRPQLILLDLLMPGITGYDFLRELRSDASLKETAVIVMSAQDLSDEAAPLAVDVQLACPDGFSLTQLVLALQAMLAVATSPATLARDTAPAPRADRAAELVW
jgi:signal transduction histidine kinase/DNA-binding response OmpR family regulator